MCDAGYEKEERLVRKRQEQQEKEDALMATPYNTSDKTFKIGSEGPWEEWIQKFHSDKDKHKARRQAAEDAELAYVVDNSVHLGKEGDPTVAGERLYQDFEDRQKRYFKKVQQEVEKDLANCLRTIGEAGSFHIDDFIDFHMLDSKRRMVAMKEAQQKAEQDIVDMAGTDVPSAEVRTRALKHAADLYRHWDFHQRYLLLLRDRFHQAEHEMHGTRWNREALAETWGPSNIERMVARLSPEGTVTHPYKDVTTNVKQKLEETRLEQEASKVRLAKAKAKLKKAKQQLNSASDRAKGTISSQAKTADLDENLSKDYLDMALSKSEDGDNPKGSPSARLKRAKQKLHSELAIGQKVLSTSKPSKGTFSASNSPRFERAKTADLDVTLKLEDVENPRGPPAVRLKRARQKLASARLLTQASKASQAKAVDLNSTLNLEDSTDPAGPSVAGPSAPAATPRSAAEVSAEVEEPAEDEEESY